MHEADRSPRLDLARVAPPLRPRMRFNGSTQVGYKREEPNDDPFIAEPLRKKGGLFGGALCNICGKYTKWIFLAVIVVIVVAIVIIVVIATSPPAEAAAAAVAPAAAPA